MGLHWLFEFTDLSIAIGLHCNIKGQAYSQLGCAMLLVSRVSEWEDAPNEIINPNFHNCSYLLHHVSRNQASRKTPAVCNLKTMMIQYTVLAVCVTVAWKLNEWIGMGGMGLVSFFSPWRPLDLSLLKVSRTCQRASHVETSALCKMQ